MLQKGDVMTRPTNLKLRMGIPNYKYGMVREGRNHFHTVHASDRLENGEIVELKHHYRAG